MPWSSVRNLFVGTCGDLSVCGDLEGICGDFDRRYFGVMGGGKGYIVILVSSCDHMLGFEDLVYLNACF